MCWVCTVYAGRASNERVTSAQPRVEHLKLPAPWQLRCRSYHVCFYIILTRTPPECTTAGTYRRIPMPRSPTGKPIPVCKYLRRGIPPRPNKLYNRLCRVKCWPWVSDLWRANSGSQWNLREGWRESRSVRDQACKESWAWLEHAWKVPQWRYDCNTGGIAKV